MKTPDIWSSRIVVASAGSPPPPPSSSSPSSSAEMAYEPTASIAVHASKPILPSHCSVSRRNSPDFRAARRDHDPA
jgi:hypothetical protein